MKNAEADRHLKFSLLLRLCLRIIVFRPFVDQLPKLDVAGSIPVARSAEKAPSDGAFSV